MLSFQPVLFDARVQKEAVALRDQGHAVRILYVEDPRFLAGVGDVESAWKTYREATSGIETEAVFLRSREWRAVPRWMNKCGQLIELVMKFGLDVVRRRADVYHCHDLQPGVFAILGKVVHRAAIVYDAHELEVRAASRLKRAMQAVYERIVVRFSDRCLTVNRTIADVMATEYRREIAVVENRPIPIAPESLQRGRLTQHAALSPSEKAILYVGYVTPHGRGIEKVVEALPFVDDSAVFLILGVGRLEEYKSHLYGLVDRLGVDRRRVRFLDPVPPGDVVHLLSGADVSVMLIQAVSESYEACAPNKLFQSIMARTPILASDNKTLPAFVRDNGVGPIGEVVDQTDVRAIANAVDLMLRPERQEMYRRNLDALAGDYGWDQEADALVTLYRRL
jgi:glycosyltransferase involved in cell wall biosynthesis